MAEQVAIVTGGTGGLGYETARGLAARGLSVIVAGRDPAKGEAAVGRIKRDTGRDARFVALDLARLDAVRDFASRIEAVDILVNNAGLMAPPARQITADGFEIQFGVNYLGHFVLTALLLPHLLASEAGGRVVSVSSLAHRGARLRFDDLQSEHGYRPMRAYGQSKLAMLVFALELQRRASAHGTRLKSVAAHPGWARTDIIRVGDQEPGPRRVAMTVARSSFNAVAQSALDGARPILEAAISPDIVGGAYLGPSGFGEIRGPSAPARIMPQAWDADAARRLWTVSEQLGKTVFAWPAAERAPAGVP